MSRRPPEGTPPAAVPDTRPIPAATVALLRPGPAGVEVLLTRRPATMAFGPDILVFPGGRVDPADQDAAVLAAAGLSEAAAAANLGVGIATDGGMSATAALAHHVAAVRETAEETGITVAVADLIPLTRWVTPRSLPRRFDVRFFAAFVPPGTRPIAGSTEVAEVRWMTPTAALTPPPAGSPELWQPTFVTLQQLEGLTDDAAVRAAFAVGSSVDGPVIEYVRSGLARVEAAWAAGIPGRRADGLLIGDRAVVVVDPADPTGVTSDAIEVHVARTGAHLAGIVITGLDPERHAGVEHFAQGLGLPVAGPTGTAARAPYPVLELAADDRLPFGDAATTLGDVLRLR